MDNIFDGIQRPLQDIRAMSQSIYIPKGISTVPLDMKKEWLFRPSTDVEVRIGYCGVWGLNFVL